MRKYPSVAICNLGQVYTRAGAKKVLNSCKEIKRPLDVELKHYWEHDLRIFAVYPMVVAHAATAQDTTIGSRKRNGTLMACSKKQAYHFKFAIYKWWNYYK